MFDPSVGRFTAADPLGVPSAPNPYALAGDDPVNFADLSGLYAATHAEGPLDERTGGGGSPASGPLSGPVREEGGTWTRELGVGEQDVMAADPYKPLGETEPEKIKTALSRVKSHFQGRRRADERTDSGARCLHGKQPHTCSQDRRSEGCRGPRLPTRQREAAEVRLRHVEA